MDKMEALLQHPPMRECDCDQCCDPAELKRRQRKRELSREYTAAVDAYREAGGKAPLIMRREVFYNIHADFRSEPGSATHPSCLVYMNGTTLVPVTLGDGDSAPRKPRRKRSAWVEND